MALLYNINGDFGKVRYTRKPPGESIGSAPFPLSIAGWHHCNDLYSISRSAGMMNSHLLLFSISEGGRLQLADREVIELPANSAAWIPPGSEHSYYTAKGEWWEFYWMHLNDTPVICFEELFEDSFCLPLLHMENIRQELEKLICCNLLTAAEFRLECSRTFSNVYHILLQDHLQQNHSSRSGDELVLGICRDMANACAEDWNLTQLSEQYFISVPQLIRRFKAETGMTPYAYLLNLRLHTAKLYLTHTGLSVDEISRKTGFSSTSNFIQQFRKCWGTTPQKYRGNC